MPALSGARREGQPRPVTADYVVSRHGPGPATGSNPGWIPATCTSSTRANYAASKSGLFGLTKSLAREAIFQLNRAQRPAGDGIGVTGKRGDPGLHRHGNDGDDPG